MDQISTPTTKPPPSRPPPQLPEELVEEVLLRFPPDDPSSQLRAALVCKPWCRLLSARGFRRRFAQFHRTPPTLGFVCNLRDEDLDSTSRVFAEFVPTSSFRPPRALSREWRAVDARHGRVLLHREHSELERFIGDTFAIWDPMSDKLRELPILKEYKDRFSWSAAVLCAGGDACDHLDCNRGPFQVVVVAADFKHIRVRIYSSEVRVWSMPTKPLCHSGDYLHFEFPSVLLGNVLYFAFGIQTNILKYNLATEEMSVIDAPVSFFGRRSMLTTTEGGCLGIAMVAYSVLYLWTREVSPERDAGRWTQTRVIELVKLLPIGPLSISPCVVRAEGTDVIFVLTEDALYTIDVNTSQIKKVCDVSGSPTSIFPYMSFYTPRY
jgi:hypothetical protein